MKKQDIKNILNDLVYKRFKNRYKLQVYLKEKFKKTIITEQSWKNKEKDEYDFLIVGTLDNENDNIYCVFDIYYTKSKNHIFITEVNYEFE